MINYYQKYHRFELTFELVGCHIIQPLLCTHMGQYGFHKVHPIHNVLPKIGTKMNLSEERTLFQLVFTSEWLEFMPGNSLLNWSISADFFGSFLLLLLLEAMMRVIPTSVELRLKASHHLLLPVFAPQFALKALFLLPPDSRNCGSHCKMPQSLINTIETLIFGFHRLSVLILTS